MTGSKGSIFFSGILLTSLFLSGPPALANSGSAQNSLARETRCLAETIYHEARGESLRGQEAVGEVIVNRSKSRRFPSDICDVVRQIGQFAPSGPIRERKSFNTASRIASKLMAGDGNNLTDGAAYFHTPGVKPKWARSKTRTTKIGSHIFYR